MLHLKAIPHSQPREHFAASVTLPRACFRFTNTRYGDFQRSSRTVDYDLHLSAGLLHERTKRVDPMPGKLALTSMLLV